MKIRIKGNSLRYRLTRPEVDRLLRTGLVEEQVHFGNGVLSYSIKSAPQPQLSAEFSGNRITLYFPEGMLEEWVYTDKVGFEHRPEGLLHLLVEKDFTCLDKSTEDQSDHYPNPLLKKSV